MKKFSKVKYFGAVAAALLAVAPIAAPVVSQVASPAIAQAATTQIDTAAQDLVNSTFKSTVNTTFTGSNAASATNVAGINSAVTFNALGSIAARFIASADPQWGNDPFSSYQVSINLDGNAAGATGDNLANILNTNPQKTYTATVNVYKANSSTVIATKTIVVNNANYASVSFPALNVNVGDDAYKTINVADVASALKVTTADGVPVNVYASDFVSTNLWYNTSDENPATGYQPLAVKEFISNPDSAASTTYNHFTPTSDSKFIKNGVVYQVFSLEKSNSALYNTLHAVASANGEINNTKDSAAEVVSKGGVYANNDAVFVVRPVNISTGDNDVAYAPVFKYNYAGATATTGARVDTYRDGQTVQLNPTDAAKVHADPANDKLSSDDVYKQLGTAVCNLLGATTTSPLYAIENSFLTTGGAQASVLPVVQADFIAKVKAAIPNVYTNGTYKIPVSVTNSRGLKATIYVPVTLGVQVGSPVARVFPVNTTITKGDKFDRYADVSFQNSDADATLIPNDNISVSGNVDTSTPGNYTLTYTVTNTAGKTGTFVRTITVVDGSLTESNADGVVYINKADGASIYSDQATTKATDKTLDNTTAWKFHSVVKDSAGKIVAYNLGGKQYVKAGEVSTSPVKAQAGVFTVNYPANSKWSIAVYNSDLKVVKLIPAKSSWLTFGTKTLKDGKSYYNLGGNQWVRTDYGFWNAK